MISKPNFSYGPQGRQKVLACLILMLSILMIQPSLGQTYSPLHTTTIFVPSRARVQGFGPPFYLYRILHNFTGGPDGAEPTAGLARDTSGNLYGTTTGGGTTAGICSSFGSGCGVVFKLSPTGHETVLHTFTGGADGGTPLLDGALILDQLGNLYGTASAGGSFQCTGACVCPGAGGCGVVFKVGSDGQETVLHTFTGNAEGYQPLAGLVRDAHGVFYGTSFTASDTLLVFRMTPSGNVHVIQNSFPNCAAPSQEEASGDSRVTLDSMGSLYGVEECGGGAFGQGAIFKLSQSGSYRYLYNFLSCCADPGGYFHNTPLVRDVFGNIYGTTQTGGSFGVGTVFKVDPLGKETVLHTFTGGIDGGSSSGLIQDSSLLLDTRGNLYGSTPGGGSFGNGVVFKLSPTGEETVLHAFTGRDGSAPIGSFTADLSGNIYGTAAGGGAFGHGVVFELSPVFVPHP